MQLLIFDILFQKRLFVQPIIGPINEQRSQHDILLIKFDISLLHDLEIIFKWLCMKMERNKLSRKT